jgi:ribosome maturation factor RimP
MYPEEVMMKWIEREPDALFDKLAPVAHGLGMELVDALVSRHKGSIQVRCVVTANGTDDCGAFHHAIVPTLDLEFGGSDYSVEVSTPGIERRLKSGRELACFLGKDVRFLVSGENEWRAGVLEKCEKENIVIRTKDEAQTVPLSTILKAKLDPAGGAASRGN